jgi:hypothetical protein
LSVELGDEDEKDEVVVVFERLARDARKRGEEEAKAVRKRAEEQARGFEALAAAFAKYEA